LGGGEEAADLVGLRASDRPIQPDSYMGQACFAFDHLKDFFSWVKVTRRKYGNFYCTPISFEMNFTQLGINGNDLLTHNITPVHTFAL
jgi:hypothetical protein